MRLVQSCLAGVIFAVVCYLSPSVARADTYWVHLTITATLGPGITNVTQLCASVKQTIQTATGTYDVDVGETGLTGWVVSYPAAPCYDAGGIASTAGNPIGYAQVYSSNPVQYWYLTGNIDNVSLTQPTDITPVMGTLDTNPGTVSYVKSLWTTVTLPSSNTLTVAGTGNGGGTISGSGFNCIISGNSSAGTCSQNIPTGTQVSLTAMADSSSTFTGWSGCNTAVSALCSLTMKSSSQQVTASFSNTHLQIISPADSANFTLSQSDYAATSPISFDATGSYNVNINWSLSTSYTTSGGVGPFNDSKAFSTLTGASHSETFIGVGGQTTILATQGSASANETITISGVAIPNAAITSRLRTLYAGNHSGLVGYTPDLLCHIAVQESAYRQFAVRTLYKVKARWPNENFPTSQVASGSYIGLLQVPASMQNAFDWHGNTQSGLDVLNSKLGKILNYQAAKMAAIPGLPTMSGQQVEDSALLLYGGFSARDPQTCQLIPSGGPMRYYVPVAGPSWGVNPAVNCVSTQGNSPKDYVYGSNSHQGIRTNIIPN